MTVYLMHRQSMSTDTVFQMEAFPSVERAASALKVRARTQVSRAYPLSPDPEIRKAWPWEGHCFPEADGTGFMLVWRRPNDALPPGPTDTPDELWRLTPRGAVERLPWEEGMPAKSPRKTPYAELSAAQRRTAALQFARSLPEVKPAFTLGLSPDYLRALHDLAEGSEAEDALLRMIQAAHS